MRFKVMVARFPGRFYEDPRSSDWAWETVIKAKADPRIESVHRWWKADTPITMTRNQAVVEALDLGIDVLLMVDSDMRPDCGGPGGQPGKPFWESSLEFWWERRHAPMVIGAPYVGPPPNNNIYVFPWDDFNNRDKAKLTLPQYPRHQAAIMSGIQRCGALPTGVIAYFNVPQLFRREPSDPGKGMLPQKDRGWFYYEWTDRTCSRKASTEDVTNTRDLGLLLPEYGIPDAGVYCNWDAWAAHIKPEEQGPPEPVEPGRVWDVFRNHWESERQTGDRIVEVNQTYPALGGEEAA